MDLKKEDGLLKQVGSTIASVLQRRRFGYRVEPIADGKYRIFSGTDTFQMTVCSFAQVVDVDVRVEGDTDNPYSWRMFYRLQFRRSKIPNLRKVGVTLANKIKCKPIHDVIKE